MVEKKEKKKNRTYMCKVTNPKHPSLEIIGPIKMVRFCLLNDLT